MIIHLTSLYRELNKQRRKKEVVLRNRLKHEGENHFPFRLLTVSLFGIGMIEALLRFVIVLTHAPKESFELFYKTTSSDSPRHDFDTFQKFHKHVRVFTVTGGMVIVMSSALVGLALNFATGVYQTALAATYSWSQTNWNTLTSNTTAHPAPANWTEYTATTTSIIGGASLTLGTTAASTIQTSDTDFTAGTQSSTTVSGTGSASSVVLSASAVGNIAQLDEGGDHSCALKTDGTVYCWGNNPFGAVGDNTVTQRNTPVQVLGVGASGNLTGVSSIAAGELHVCALKTDGTVFCWGYNGLGALGDNTITQRSTPVQVLGVGASGNLTGLSSVTTGVYHSCALKTDGTVYCWGYNNRGQLGDNTVTQRNTPVQVLGVGASGNLTGVSSIAAGELHVCALKTDGTVFCWGSNGLGALGDNTVTERHTPVQVLGVGASGNLTGVSSVTTGAHHSCALKTDGTVYCWGYNDNGQLGDNTVTQRNTPVQVRGVGASGNLTGVSSISAWHYHTCALKTDGTVYCWGNNSGGQLGDNTLTQRNTPVQVLGVGASGNLTGVSSIAVGGSHNCALKTDDTVFCWGYNASGQLGDNTVTQRKTPVQVLGVGASGNFSVNATVYNTPGIFTSLVIDTGPKQAFTTLSYNKTVPVSTTLTIDARAGNTATPDGTWTAWQLNIASGGDISGFGANRYVQYRANFSTSDTTQTPSLSDLTVNYNVYASGQTLTSSKFNSGTAANLMGGVTWNEDTTLPTGTYVALSLRSSSTAVMLDSTSWATALTSTSTNCSKTDTAVTCLSSALPAEMRDGTDDQWFQYMVTLSSSGGATPTLTDVSVSYVVNDLPELQNVTASEQADGTVLISYETRDPDTSAGTFTPGFVAPSFEYSTDGGSTWTPIVSNLSSDATSSKAVSQTTWNTYGGTWTAKNVLNGLFSATTQIRVTVNDGETANNITQLATLNFTLDEKNPTVGAVPLLIYATSSPSRVTFDVTDDSSLQMKVGRLPDLSDASWVAFATSTTIMLVADPDTVYAQFRDVNANQSAIVAVTTPQTPASMIYRDLSNTNGTPIYRLFISWGVAAVPGPGFGNYRVYRSTDGSTYTLYSTISDRLQNYLIDDNLDSSTTYYYKVYTDDVNGNTSYYSAAVSHMPNGQGGTDTTAPTITGVSSTSTPQTATINWTTDELSDSTVGYCLAPCTVYSTTQGISSFVTSHGVVLNGLTPGQTYNYSVTSRDPALNSASSTGLSLTTLPGPTISNVAVTRASNTGADITWDTDIPATAYVGYATNTPPSGGVESITGVTALNTTRTVTLTGLTAGQTYYFYVRSQDALGNWAENKNIVDGVTTYYKFNTSNDTAAPVITSIATSTVTDIAAVVSWITDEIANSTVEWGTSTGVYASSTSYSTFDMTHFLELTGLSPVTLYYYHVVSADQSGNTATSSEYTFTTLEEQFGSSERIIQTTIYAAHRDPDGVAQILYDAALKEIQDLKAALATNSEDLKAELAKKTEELAAALKELGEIRTEIFGLKADEITDPKELLRIVTEKFSALTKVFEKDAALDLSESDLSPAAQTLRDLAEAVPPPIIKGAPQIDIASDRTVISWSSDKDTNSVIALARTLDYDPLQANPYTQEYGIFDVYAKEHKVTLENLLPSTEYHFQIRSTSLLGTKVKTRDFTFNTPVQLPVISDAHIAQVENGKVRLSWHTNVLTNAAVRYTPFERGKPVPAKAATFGKPDYVNDHVVVLEQLKSGTTYGLELLSTDPYGNTAKRDMANYTTGKDTEAPMITRVRSDITVFPGAGNKIQAIIFWETNELATSQVFYEEGTSGDASIRPKQATQETIDMATNHTVVIANWKSDTVYRFRVVSVDANGNTVESKDFTVKTPQQKASIIDIIINNFSTTFNWTKNIGL